ncbi:MAG: DNA polymerase III subunit gamma/tau [Trichocoleus desertorum ATA4-8-CV12]|jgi:DNA polymerase-3 subunit gamma/tau|nr:DNA polymerase III subunit gamma/tau [Trichocoleus desertorum ATA4-8-CV12]
MPYEPLHHKYRPQTFAELVGQEAIATTLTNALRQQRIAPAYLFTGARGTGKTSSARILAKSLNCLQSDAPTETPCGKCEVCRAIANGSALDVIEIDAASNTGVDNIRELIERSQFSPVQCRHKVYVIDECLTGDSLVQTSQGLIRIDSPEIQGKQVLSYNDQTGTWEFKQVLRWFDQGVRSTYLIKTTNREIRCTGNHLIRTDQGWKPAAELKPGMKILSPHPVKNYRPSGPSWSHSDLNVPVAVARDYKSPRSLAKLVSNTSNATGRNTLQNKTTTKSLVSQRSWQNWKNTNPVVLVGAENNSAFLSICSRDRNQQPLQVSKAIGDGTPTSKATASGQLVPTTSLTTSTPCLQKPWASSTAPYWATAPSPTPTATADSPACPGLMVSSSKLGWNTKLSVWQDYAPNLEPQPIRDTGKSQPVAVLPVTPNSQKFFRSSDHPAIRNKFLETGSSASLLKDWPGGIWTTAHSLSRPKVARKFSSIQKATQPTKINLLQSGLRKAATQPTLEVTQEPVEAKSTPTWQWEQILAENGSQTCGSTPSHQWTTNLEQVESVRLDGAEAVYDIEVEDNHNFVANGLLAHNCHMLSTAAFNALLKTLEEPPDRVVFVLATTDPQRVLPTIISRCQRFDFRRIPLEAMVHHLSAIAHNESINIAPDAVQLVGQIAQGGLRDAESLLDQLSLLEGQVTVERVWDLVGAVPERDLLALLQAIATNDPAQVLDGARHLMNRGREPLIVLQNLASFYRDLLIAKTAPSRGDLVAITPPTWAQLCQFAQQLPIALILEGQKYLRAAEVQIKNSTQPRLWLEVTLLGLLPSELGVEPPVVTAAPIAPAPIAPQWVPTPLTILPVPTSSAPLPATTTASSSNGKMPSVASQLQQLLSQVASKHQLSTPAADLEVLAGAIAQALLHDQEFRSALSALISAPQPTVASISETVATNSHTQVAVVTETVVPATAQNGRAEVVETSHVEVDEAIAVVETAAIEFTEPDLITSIGEPSPWQEAAAQEPELLEPPDNEIPAVEAAPALNLEQLWQKVLGCIELRGTQALLGQQCYLLGLDKQQAKVGVRSQPLIKIAQRSLPIVEEAFHKAVGYPVKVSLVVASAAEPAPAIPAAPEGHAQPSAAIAPQPPRLAERTPSSSSQAPDPGPQGASPPAIAHETNHSHSSPTSTAATPPEPITSVDAIAAIDPPSLQNIPWQEEDEVTRAAKRLAEFFGGKVVDLESGWTSDGNELVVAPPISEWDETDSGAEADEVPF